jgi:hypothetical protein
MKYHPDFVNEYKFDENISIEIDINGIKFSFQVFQNIGQKVFNEEKCRIILNEFIEIIKKYPKIDRRKINIIVYDIPKKKQLPAKKQYIESKHINSGYCYPTSTSDDINIVIYRREEFYKVLIHELLHFFDIIPYNQELQTLYANMFSSVPNINVNEAIVELYAIHINCEIISRLKNKDLKKLLEIEYNFSITQCKKLLKQQDVDIFDIVKNTFSWTENTNAFSYFILKHIFLHFVLNKTTNELHENFDFQTIYSKNQNIQLSKNSI